MIKSLEQKWTFSRWGSPGGGSSGSGPPPTSRDGLPVQVGLLWDRKPQGRSPVTRAGLAPVMTQGKDQQRGAETPSCWRSREPLQTKSETSGGENTRTTQRGPGTSVLATRGAPRDWRTATSQIEKWAKDMKRQCTKEDGKVSRKHPRTVHSRDRGVQT